MKKLLTVFGIFMVPLINSLAQQNSLYSPREEFDPKKLLWLQGSVTFKNGQTFPGRITYNQQFDVVYFDLDGEIKTLGTQVISGFSFKEPNQDLYHVFRSYPERTPSGYKRDRFFEQLITGYCDVVRIAAYSTVFTFDPSATSSGKIETIDESRYFLFVDGELDKIKKFHRQIYGAFPITKKEIDRLIERDGLDVKKREDQLKLIQTLNEKMTGSN